MIDVMRELRNLGVSGQIDETDLRLVLVIHGEKLQVDFQYSARVIANNSHSDIRVCIKDVEHSNEYSILGWSPDAIRLDIVECYQRHISL